MQKAVFNYVQTLVHMYVFSLFTYFFFHLGDFGISKVMSTRGKEAHTVLGTPYYISPEMCEGKGYDEKSDIWALGCIVYEMACLQKTFEGSNLPGIIFLDKFLSFF